MTTFLNSLLTGIISFLFFSCATIMNSSNQQINITSEPLNAKVFVDEIEYGKTPVIAKLTRKDNHIVKIEMEGYEPQIITLNRKTSNWFAGNCLFGGLIGMGIDALTGAMYILEPEEIKTTLTNGTENVMNEEDILIIKIVLNPEPEWKKFSQLKKM